MNSGRHNLDEDARRAEIGYSVFRESNDGFFVFDPATSTVLDVNPTAQRITGYRKKQLVDRELAEVFVSPEGNITELGLALERTQFFHSREDFRLVRKSGKSLPVNLTVSRIHTSPDPLGLIVFRDISKRIEAEKNVRKAARLEATATLAGGVAHDFNNLMAVVLGNAEILRTDPEMGPDALKRLDALCMSAHRAGDLSRDLLAFAQGGMYDSKLLSLGDTVTEVMHLQIHDIPPGISVQRTLDDTNFRIKADPVQMGQVVTALLKNAVEAIDGRGHIRISTSLVTVESDSLGIDTGGDQSGKYVHLQVSDTGCGMDSATAAKVFEPFFSTKGTGRGLSLAAAYGIVKNHGGKITFDTEEGTGTVFDVFFPLAEEKSARGSDIPEKSRPAGGAGTVLVIDDEEIVRDVLGEMVRSFGYDVLVAEGGEDAIRIARRHNGTIEAALLDMGMPGMNGAEAFPFLVNERPDMKILICSGYTQDEAAQSLLEAGAVGFVNKPCGLDVLSQALKEAMARD